MNGCFEEIKSAYAAMDAAYDAVADQYGFHCQGCEDNCCTSLFFHHTYVEQAYLLSGVTALPQADQDAARKRAQEYVKQTFDGREIPESQKLLCPLNQDGRCMVYAQRPMICRLHGLPHELNRPGAGKLQSPGCDAGGFQTYIPFDRTPLYQHMARAEMAYRQTHQLRGKIKKTIAEMLTDT